MFERTLESTAMSVARGWQHLRAATIAAGLLGVPGSALATNVVTYHYDNFRTGWNSDEQVLNVANVESGSLGVLATEAVDSRIDAQPLIVTGVNVSGQGTHDVVYVATENNTVYAFDASSGAQLLSVNFGQPVPPSAIQDRHDNIPMGIQSTPVIDTTSNTLYVITFTFENAVPTYRLHALDLGSLTDQVPSVVVVASSTLTDGSQLNFLASEQRQRPALLEANGNVYAAFGSFGDRGDDFARGWLLGWQAGSLQSLAANDLTNHRATSTSTCWQGNKTPGPCFLSSIWMSGFGVAADTDGSLFFATGNSDSGTYDGVSNIQESVVKFSSDLTTMLSIFTPWNVASLDAKDGDLASGGVLLVPASSGLSALFAVSASKSGEVYFLDHDNLGGHVSQPPDAVLGEYKAGSCWCGSSYYTGSDGIGRVVTSGGTRIKVWKVITAPAPALQLGGTSVALASGQDGGFFTTISSSGTQKGTAIIWAVGRPLAVNGSLTLYAFDTKGGQPLYSTAIGSWPSPNANANVVPVVANGKVYVSGGDSLTILGIAEKMRAPVAGVGSQASEPRVRGHEICGRLISVHGRRLVLRLRNAKTMIVDAAEVLRNHSSEPLILGRAFAVDGTYERSGVYRAQLIFRVKDSPALWLADK
jgi:hypothetical protein